MSLITLDVQDPHLFVAEGYSLPSSLAAQHILANLDEFVQSYALCSWGTVINPHVLDAVYDEVAPALSTVQKQTCWERTLDLALASSRSPGGMVAARLVWRVARHVSLFAVGRRYEDIIDLVASCGQNSLACVDNLRRTDSATDRIEMANWLAIGSHLAQIIQSSESR